MQIVILIVVGVIIYGRTVNYGLVSDDTDAYQRGQKMIKDKEPVWKQWASEVMCHNICNIKRCHSYNVIVHLLNVVLIYIVFGSNTMSFMAALLFLLNPSNNQGSTWLSGRGYAIVTTIALTIWYWKDILWLTPILYYTGLSWGFSVAFVPVLYLLTPYKYMLLIIPLSLLVKHLTGGGIRERIESKKSTSTPMMKSMDIQKVPLFFKTFTYYLGFCLFPIRCGMYHSFMYSWGVSPQDNKEWLRKDWRFWTGIVVFMLYVYVMTINMFTLIGIGMFWWLINMAMWCHYPFTIQQAIGERYVYLPNVGLMVAVSSVIIGM